MHTEDLIENISQNAEPVKLLSPPLIRMASWFAISLLCIGIGVSLMGLRPDLLHDMKYFQFILESVLILVVAIMAAATAFVLSIPGRDRGRLYYVGFVPMLALVALLAWRIWHPIGIGSEIAPLAGQACLRDIFILGIAPGILLFMMIRHAAPLKFGWVGALGMLAVASLAAFGLQFTCSGQGAIHLLLWHIAPVIAIGAAGIVLGRLLLRW